MIIDDFRNGKAVTIEVKDNRIVAARVNNLRPPKGETPIKPSVVLAQRTESQSLNGRRDHTHIDLGLAILCSKEGWERYGSRHTLDMIASFCGCSRQAIDRIEKKAMRKIRASLYRDKSLEADLKQMFGK
jgi:hypothetical protein